MRMYYDWRKYIFCKLCEVEINSGKKKYNVQQRIGREKHEEALKKNAFHPFIQQLRKFDFNADVCSANIPLNKINNERFGSFLLKYCNKTILN